jgi:hypothetical protein
MNEKAIALGMTRTHYDDSTGLSPSNVSTANDLAKLVRAAPTTTSFAITRPRPRITSRCRSGHTLGFNNSNALVKNSAWDIQLQKTGYIREAGRCVVMLVTHREQADGDRAPRFDRQVHARGRRAARQALAGDGRVDAGDAFKAVMKQTAPEDDSQQAHPGQVRGDQSAAG